MQYNSKLGMIGNIKLLFSERNHTNNKVFNETNAREQADRENREAVEQSLTDLYLDGIQAQQDITSAYLEIAELKSV